MVKKVTIYDISEAAGVSACSVSWVLRNHPRSRNLSLKTRQRILDTAEKMGYICNQLASATSTGQVNTIAVLLKFNELRNLVPMNQIMAGIMLETAERKFGVKVFSEDDPDSAFRSIMENRIGKVISMSLNRPSREKIAELAEKYSLDLVYAYEHGHGRFPAVNTDNAEMTSAAVRYLAAHGHSRIGLLCVPHSWFYIEDRHNGYLRGMEQCGLKVDPRWISTTDEIEQSVGQILALPKKERPTAFVALSDSVAMKAQRQAWKMKLRIPEDFSVVGIGDTDASRLAIVPITTFRETLSETGKLLVRLVLGEKTENSPDKFNVYLTHAELIERESVFNINPTNANRRSK